MVVVNHCYDRYPAQGQRSSQSGIPRKERRLPRNVRTALVSAGEEQVE